MREGLSDLNRNVTEWLKFAEAKNAGLIALLSALISLALERASESGDYILQIYAMWAICCFAVGLALALISFLPKLSIPEVLQDWQKSDTKSGGNCLYFGDIAHMGLDAFRDECKKNVCGFEPVLGFSVLTEQIHVNSCIAQRKYILFTGGMWFTLMGVFTPIVLLVSFQLRRV